MTAPQENPRIIQEKPSIFDITTEHFASKGETIETKEGISTQ